MIEHKFHLRGRYCFVDEDLARGFCVNVSQLREISSHNESRFIPGSRFLMDESDLLVLKTVDRYVVIGEAFAYTRAGVFVLSMYIDTPKAHEVSLRFIKEMERPQAMFAVELSINHGQPSKAAQNENAALKKMVRKFASENKLLGKNPVLNKMNRPPTYY